jgi:hypothetical protein
MMRLWLTLGLILVAAFGSTAVNAQDFSRGAGETDLAFAKRVLHLTDDSDAHVTRAAWNGVSTLFVDYETPGEYGERPLLALRETPAGLFSKIDITTGEQEGGVPNIAAIGFANADHDPAKELIVILAWAQQHYDANGTLYEVRIFDDPQPGQTALTLLKLSDKFGMGCDCASRDGKSTDFRFKTVAAVKAELKRLGY